MSKCLRAISRACDEKTFRDSVLGIHLEGPFLSPEDGPRGVHPIQHIRRPNWEEFCRLQDSANGNIRIVTLAPELEGAIALIERLTKSGIIPAIGHTAADEKAIREAVAAGARLSTHLGNGSHAFLPRLTNYVWEQLAIDELWASFILDGHHLPASVAKSMFRCKGTKKSILISDAIAAAGLGSGSYRLGEMELTVSPSQRVERTDLQGSGYLAGSALELLRGVENAARFGEISLEDAFQMASTNPSLLLGLSDRFGTLKAGVIANLIVFRMDPTTQRIELDHTVKQGDFT
jgi:N-acetylglucosamine-6-phosphate deacetylase